MSFIPGMTGAIASMGPLLPPLLTSVSFVDYSASYGSSGVAWPAGAQEGDAVLLYDWCYVENDGGDPTYVLPSGFTQIQNLTGFSGEIDAPDQGKTRIIVSRRILDGTESLETDVIGMSGNREEAKIMLLFRGNVPITDVVPGSLNAYVNFGNPPAQSIVAAAVEPPVAIYAFHAKQSGTLSFTTNSPALTTIVPASNRILAGYRLYNSTPANHSIDADGGGSGSPLGINLVSGYLQFS
jgi:hypothetical protein